MSGMQVRRRFPSLEAPTPPAASPQEGLFQSARNKVKDLAGRFGFGLLAGAIAAPLSKGAISLIQAAGFLPQLADRASLLKESVAKLAKMGISIDADAISKAVCPMSAYVEQLNVAFPEMGPQTAASVKAMMIATAGVAQPIFEEAVFRGFFQELVLKRFCPAVMNWVSPEQAAFFHSTAAKVLRVVMTAGLFATLHLANGETMADSYVAGQASSAFLKGLFYGALQESSIGLPGTIGAHIANNLIAIAPHLMSC